MPLPGIEQPEFIPVSAHLRLHRYAGECAFALPWYQDEQTLLMVNGNTEPYDLPRLEAMYRWQDEHGELYFIEVPEGDRFLPIGDVAFSPEDMPIVIGNAAYRGKGIGLQVIHALIERAQHLGLSVLHVQEIYDHNLPSQRLFAKAGFVPFDRTEKGMAYKLTL